jgi:hypothetical protein
VQNTWLVKINFKNFFLILNQVNFFIFFLSKLNRILTFKNSLIFMYIHKIKNIEAFFSMSSNKKIDKFNLVKNFNTYFGRQTNDFSDKLTITQPYSLNFFSFKFFYLFFLFGFSNNASLLRVNSVFNSFFIKSNKKDVVTVNVNKLVSR